MNERRNRKPSTYEYVKSLEADLPWIAVIDDGCGMAWEELLEAMRLGSKDPGLECAEHDLGLFGLGLKTNSFSQCRELTVLTRGYEALNGMRRDLDRVSKTNKWEITELSQNELPGMPCELPPDRNGTLVLWGKIDRLELIGMGEIGHEALNEMMSAVKQHLARIFHRFLGADQWPQLTVCNPALGIAEQSVMQRLKTWLARTC